MQSHNHLGYGQSARSLESEKITTQLGKFIVVLRMVLLYPIMASWGAPDFVPLEAVGVVSLATMSLVAFVFWDKVVAFVVMHPLAMSVDIFISILVMARASSSSPYFLYLGATALLIGLLFEGVNRIILTGILITAFVLVALLTHTNGKYSAHQSVNDVVSAFVIGFCVFLGSRMRTLQTRVDTALRLATRNAREAALGEERSRIARELHDSTVKSLVGISLLSDTIAKQPDQGVRLSAIIKSAAEEAIDDSRHLLSNLRSGSSDDFESRLRATLDELEVLHGTPIELHLNGCDVRKDLAHNVEKIIVEAVTNAATHSGTDKIRVFFSHADSHLRVAVTDYGNGFRVRKVRDGHLGLTSMRERATDAGGALTISSTPGKGTIVIFDIDNSSRDSDD